MSGKTTKKTTSGALGALVRRLAVLLLLVLALPAARAAITCTTITSPGASINYVANSTTSVQTSFTVSCTRGSTSDPTSVTYSVAANNGLNPNGQNNRATHAGGSTLRYDVYTASNCGQTWKGSRTINDTITWAGGTTGTQTKQTFFWTCITNSQNPSASGPYTDTVTMTLSYSGGTVVGTAAVRIYAPAVCTFGTRVADTTFNYTAFGAQQSVPRTFTLTCTQGMPYTLATDVTEGVLVGVRYQLALSTPTANGTGAAVSHTLTITVLGNQAGTCTGGSCSGTATHTLTISY